MKITISDIQKMLDLRSDTSTLPTAHMWSAISHAKLGDGGRVDLTGRGEDPTVYELEKLAAELLGKEEAMYIATGSLGNHTAMYAAAERGDLVLVEKSAHIYINEKYDFMPKFTGLIPIFYHLNDEYQIDPAEIAHLTDDYDIKVLCLENTHNYSGGTCLTPACTKAVCDIAHQKGIHVHLDGARIFNSAVAQNVDVRELVGPVDSVMFCLSKGLCAPVGSMLVGSREFIENARAVGKMLGTPMRQAGVIAAAGIVALKENIARLADDHARAQRLAQILSSIPNIDLDPRSIQTNFVYVNVAPTGLNAQQVTDGLRSHGLLVARQTDVNIRFAIHKDISEADIERAGEIARCYFASLQQESPLP